MQRIADKLQETINIIEEQQKKMLTANDHPVEIARMIQEAETIRESVQLSLNRLNDYINEN